MVAVCVALIAAVGIPSAVHASDSPPSVSAETLEYLYSLGADEIRVRPGKGASARIVLVRPTVTRFTDRPVRDATEIHPGAMLTAFGWTPQTGSLRGKTPNAAIAIPGATTQVVRIRTAAIRGDRVILRVSGIEGAVAKTHGAGALFVDSSTASAAQTQTVTLSSAPDLTMTGVVFSNGAITVTLQSDGQTLASNTFDSMGAQRWSPSLTLPGGGQVSDLSVAASFMFSTTGGDSKAFIEAMGNIVLPPPDLLAVAAGTLQFEAVPAQTFPPWPPPLPPGVPDPSFP